jgi:hypothetical protein
MLREGRLALGIASLFAMGGCYVQSCPPPAAPARSMPALASPLPEVAPDKTRVVISTDVPARVIVRRRKGDGSGDFYGGEEVWTEQVVCEQTPCAVTAPRGNHQLKFEGLDDGGRSSTAKVSFDGETVVVNHTLGQQRVDWARPVGLGLLGAGVASLIFVLSSSEGHSMSGEVGNVFLLGGLGSVIVGGVVLSASGPPSTQDGSTTQWAPPPTAKVGASLAGKF